MIASEVEIASLKLDDLVAQVIQTGDPEIRDEKGYTALMLAAVANRMDIVHWLIAEGADIRATMPDRGEWGTATYYAIDDGSWEIAWYLLEQGATAFDAEFFLQKACDRKNKAMAERLVRRLIDRYRESPTLENREQISKALPYIAEKRWYELLLELMKEGAGIEHLSRFGTTLSAALDHQQEDTARQLLELGEAQQNHFAEKILYIAVLNHDVSLTKFLLHSGVNPNTVQEEGYTPLIMAAAGRQEALVDLLLKYGADIQARDNLGRTALWYAREKGFKKIAERLIAAGATK